ncbi:hypothetical protein ACFWJT_37320 [Streptomyces sp. NPDC127069]|uniref:hypothetical protein n=1 Tax=Streptomyces sp. NPDC127069 TaxID=3347128 RepID=UPI0036669052
MSLAFFLLALGGISLVGGGTLALNIRGAADAMARRGEANAELRRHLRGQLEPPTRVVSTTLCRCLGAVMALPGLVLTLGGLLELTA